MYSVFSMIYLRQFIREYLLFIIKAIELPFLTKTAVYYLDSELVEERRGKTYAERILVSHQTNKSFYVLYLFS